MVGAAGSALVRFALVVANTRSCPAWIWDSAATALMKAKTDGRIVDPLLTQLSVWYVQQQNRIIDTNDVRGVCLDTIAMRRRHGF